MRIAFDHQVFAMHRYGGISRYIVHLAENIESLGEEAVIFAPIHRNRYLAASILDNRGWYVRDFPRGMGDILVRLSGGLARPQIAWWKPDLVHETFYSPRSSAPAGTPVVLTVHDMITEIFPNEEVPRKISSDKKKKAIQRADHVICVSESTRRDLHRSVELPEEKTSVIHHGVEKFETDQRLPEPLDRVPFLLFVGKRGHYKNFSRLLEAYYRTIKHAENVMLVAFGGGEFTPDEQRWISSRNLENRVSQVSGDDRTLGGLYRQAAALIVPSLYEGFGMPALEAMAHGCPVAASDRSSLPEVAGDAGIYFDPRDVTSITKAIRRILESEALREELMKKGRERASRFTWEKCARQTARIYRSLLN